ncbi:macro domain-containing protein (plasmid) [Bernardetia sp. Wsw4-3y2]|uniref:macro domain-containing protein n=1 Tax=Bernardetia sp. Wsw4-3y2 TaxID=3127471 RepID=UPI0030D4C32D
MKKLILIDPNPVLCNEWKKSFESYEEVEIINGYFEVLEEFDCMVSAANSFGLMDGGVDYAIIKYFGQDLEKRVQQRIIKEYRDEQPVGTSMIVETNHNKHPFIAHTPTMRVPLTISRTDNVYKAMFALLLSVHQHNNNKENNIKINTIACCGLGTATGKVLEEEAARQMQLAYKNFKNPPSRIDWNYASERQKEIIFGGNLF